MKADYKTITADNRPQQRDTEGKLLKGIIKTRLYGIWSDMHTRCYNQNFRQYKDYGGRGVTVCPEWHKDNLQGYYNFREWAIQSGYSEDLTIDRIDNDKGYSPMNCQWTDRKTQSRNRSMNHPIVVNGVQYATIAEACEALNREEDCKVITTRISRGYEPDKAFSTPIGARRGNDISVTIDGKTYKNIKEACQALGLNYHTVTVYKCNHHTTAEEAILHYLKTA